MCRMAPQSDVLGSVVTCSPSMELVHYREALWAINAKDAIRNACSKTRQWGIQMVEGRDKPVRARYSGKGGADPQTPRPH